MRKRFFSLILCVILLVGIAGQALAAEAPAQIPAEAAETPAAAPAEAAPAGPQVYLDGVLLENAHAALIDQVTYVSFTALALALRPDAAVTWEADRAVARAEGLELWARPGSLYLYANGRYLYIPGKVQVGNNETLVPVRTIAQALGAAVTWDGTVQISSQGSPLVPGEEFYNPDDLFLMSHIIYNESGNQPMEGKIAVGNVLLNRVAHPDFPSTLYDVVYQPNQFYPERTGAMEKTPNEGSVIAAKLCLEGAVILPNAYWFNGVGKSCWASRNKECIAIIGGHAFYG